MRSLPTLGGTHGFAAAANNLGQIVGWAENRVRDPIHCTAPQIFQFRAVVWGPNGNQIHELPILPGDSVGQELAFRNSSQLVQVSQDPVLPQERPALRLAAGETSRSSAG